MNRSTVLFLQAPISGTTATNPTAAAAGGRVAVSLEHAGTRDMAPPRRPLISTCKSDSRMLAWHAACQHTLQSALKIDRHSRCLIRAGRHGGAARSGVRRSAPAEAAAGWNVGSGAEAQSTSDGWDRPWRQGRAPDETKAKLNTLSLISFHDLWGAAEPA